MPKFISNKFYEDLLTSFVNKWDINNLKNLTLEQYTVGNGKDTFCYWIETKTRFLGGINGHSSFKFGVYKPKKDKDNYGKINFFKDNGYVGELKYGNNSTEVFNYMKNIILNIYNYTINKNYDKIDDFENIDIRVRWKIAYLYSNNDLSPFFSKEMLLFVTKKLGGTFDLQAKPSELQEFIRKNRPNKNFYIFANNMFNKYLDFKINQEAPDRILEEQYEGIDRKNKKSFKKHFYWERDAKFVKKYKKKHSLTEICPGCKLNVLERYGYQNFELHHIKPLSYYKDEEVKLKEKDVTFLCPNCHRVIHRLMNKTKNVIEVKEFANIIETKQWVY